MDVQSALGKIIKLYATCLEHIPNYEHSEYIEAITTLAVNLRPTAQHVCHCEDEYEDDDE